MMQRRLFSTVVRKRLFSSVPSDPKAGSSAAAAEGSFMKKNQKYAIIAIPLLLSSIVAVDIINNVNHREKLEHYCPSFVGFVRDKYGFSDEDPAERARVKFVTAELKKPVNVSVRFSAGDAQELNAVEGDRSTRQLSEEVETKLGASGDNSVIGGSTNIRLLLKADFGAPDGQHSADQSTSNSASNKTSPEYHLQSEDVTVLYDSLWAGAPAPGSRTANVDPHAELTKDVLLQRFGNVYSDIMTGLHRYSEQGAQRVPLGSLHDTSPERRSKVQAQKKPSSAAQTDFVRIQAQERIKSLEMEIGVLEQERRLGSREIDAVDSEIRARRQEITNISRKYLNYFYYF